MTTWTTPSPSPTTPTTGSAAPSGRPMWTGDSTSPAGWKPAASGSTSTNSTPVPPSVASSPAGWAGNSARRAWPPTSNSSRFTLLDRRSGHDVHDRPPLRRDRPVVAGLLVHQRRGPGTELRDPAYGPAGVLAPAGPGCPDGGPG